MSDIRGKLLERVTALIERSQEVVVAATEDTGYFSVDPEMVKKVRDLFSDSAVLLREIGVYFEERIEPPEVDEIGEVDDTDFLRQIGAGISTELATREVADLAFMGSSEILDIRHRLSQAVDEHNFWQVVSHANAGLGRVRRALIPIEAAMREFEGLPAPQRRWESLEDSLEVRRQYGMLRRAALRAGSPSGDELTVAIGKLGRRIGILRRLKIYPMLRVDDRLALRRMQKRILAYLEKPGEREGQRLWNDLVAFLGLLRAVNNRHELHEHDRRLVVALHHQLSTQAAAGDPIPPQVLERLDLLVGRDDGLDRILRRSADHRCGDCLQTLARMKEELKPADAAVGQQL